MLSSNESKVLEAISVATNTFGIVPTLQEVADATGLSLGGVRNIVLRLQYIGFLRRQHRGHRAMQVVRMPTKEAKAAA